MYDFPIKIISLKGPKTWWNPCYAFNVGFSEAKGDIVMMNQCECCHHGDMISKASEIDDNMYLTFQAYSAGAEKSDNIRRMPSDANLYQWIEGSISPMINGEPRWDQNREGWWNHIVYRPTRFHWLSAISNSNLKKLKGFDERYSQGWWYDDNEILLRMERLGLNISICGDESLYVVHQHHVEGSLDNKKICINRYVFENQTLKETGYSANYNRAYNPQ
jgi:hypothetical protein